MTHIDRILTDLTDLNLNLDQMELIWNRICDFFLFQDHTVLKHPSKDTKDLVCEFCGFSTPSQRKLRAHIHDKHEVEKHKQCSLCDYRYIQVVNKNINPLSDKFTPFIELFLKKILDF